MVDYNTSLTSIDWTEGKMYSRRKSTVCNSWASCVSLVWLHHSPSDQAVNFHTRGKLTLYVFVAQYTILLSTCHIVGSLICKDSIIISFIIWKMFLQLNYFTTWNKFYYIFANSYLRTISWRHCNYILK